MSRLFEALSDEELKRGFLKVVPRAAISPSASPAAATAETVTPKPGRQDEEAAQSLPPSKALPLNNGLPDIASPDTAIVSASPSESTETGKSRAEISPNQVNHLMRVSPDPRLVAFSNPNSLGAEKFRALVTRLDHLREHREIKSLQVTSSVINEGKTLVAGNLAVTLAKYSGSKTLLIEGDLHRPSLAALFGLSELPGLIQWWSGNETELTEFAYKLDEMPLWILPAGKPCGLPSDILSSARFAKALRKLASQFEWMVVDSTPMLPTVDANLWSRLVDGTLLVVREGMAPVKALKKGLQALDQPKLIGVVINEVLGNDHIGYNDRYYGGSKAAAGLQEKM